MFEPNQIGTISKLLGRDVHSRSTFGERTDCPFAPVNMAIGAQKTSVRADSSASRGAADEMAAQRAKILVPAYVNIDVGDRFEVDERDFVVTVRHVRRSVFGEVDHFELDLEVIPG